MFPIQCNCSEVIKSHPGTLSYHGEVIPRAEYAQFYRKISQDLGSLMEAISEKRGTEWVRQFYRGAEVENFDIQHVVNDVITRASINSSHSLFKCENCAKVFIETAPGSHEFAAYFPDQQDQRRDIPHKVEVPASIALNSRIIAMGGLTS